MIGRAFVAPLGGGRKVAGAGLHVGLHRFLVERNAEAFIMPRRPMDEISDISDSPFRELGGATAKEDNEQPFLRYPPAITQTL